MENDILISWYVLPRDHLFSETFLRKGMVKKLLSLSKQTIYFPFIELMENKLVTWWPFINKNWK